jgi:hypothetical protein
MLDNPQIAAPAMLAMLDCRNSADACCSLVLQVSDGWLLLLLVRLYVWYSMLHTVALSAAGNSCRM